MPRTTASASNAIASTRLCLGGSGSARLAISFLRRVPMRRETVAAHRRPEVAVRRRPGVAVRRRPGVAVRRRPGVAPSALLPGGPPERPRAPLAAKRGAPAALAVALRPAAAQTVVARSLRGTDRSRPPSWAKSFPTAQRASAPTELRHLRPVAAPLRRPQRERPARLERAQVQALRQTVRPPLATTRPAS